MKRASVLVLRRGLSTTQKPESLTASLLKNVKAREQYFAEIMERPQEMTFRDHLPNGVEEDKARPGEWKFTLSDSFGRNETKSGFKTIKEAEEAYERAQKEYLTPELVDLIRKKVQDRHNPGKRITEYMDSVNAQTDIRRNELEKLCSDKSILSDSTMISRDTAEAMTEDERYALNQQMVEKARKLWQKSDEDTKIMASIAAARVRQHLPDEKMRAFHDSIHRFQSQAHNNSGDVVRLIREMNSYPPLFFALLHCLDLNRIPVMKTVDSLARWNSVFYTRQGPRSLVSLRLDEMFPDEGMRESPENIALYESQFEEKSKIELAELLRVQHHLTLGWFVSAPTRVQRLVDSVNILPEATPYSGNKKDMVQAEVSENPCSAFPAQDVKQLETLIKGHNLISKKAPSAFRGDLAVQDIKNLRRSIVNSDVEAQIRAFFSDEFPEVMPSNLGLAKGKSIRGLGWESREQQWKEYHTSSDDVKQSIQTSIQMQTCMKKEDMELLTLATLQDDKKAPLEWFDGLLALSTSKERHDDVIISAAREEAKERAERFLGHFRELVPLSNRYDVTQYLRFGRAYSIASSLKQSRFSPYIKLNLPNIVAAFEPNSRLLMTYLNDFFVSDVFRFHATIAILQHELLVAQSNLFPESVPDATSSNNVQAVATPYQFELPSEYDTQQRMYKDSERFLRNELLFVRPQDKNFIESDTKSVFGLPEARATRPSKRGKVEAYPDTRRTATNKKTPIAFKPSSWEWCGMDGRWYASIEDAVRTWYTPDIVGGWRSHEEQVEAFIALRNMSDAQIHNASRTLDLHQAVRPESLHATLNTAFQIADQMDARSKGMLMAFLARHWEVSYPLFYHNGKTLWLKGEVEHLDTLESSLLQSIKSAPLKDLIPRILQNLTSLTPERISAMDYFLHSSRHDDEPLTADITLSAVVNSPEQDHNIDVDVSQEKVRLPLRRKARTRYKFEDLATIGTKEGVMVDPKAMSSKDMDEDWVQRTIYVSDIPTILGEEHLEVFFERAFGPVECITLHKERTYAYTKTTELLQGEINRLKVKKPAAAATKTKEKREGKAHQQIRELTFTEDMLPGTSETRSEMVKELNARQLRFKKATEEYIKNAYDAILWYNENFSTAEVVWATDQDLQFNKAQRLEVFRKLGVDNIDHLETNLRTRSLKGDKLIERLFTLIDESRKGAHLIEEFVGRVIHANLGTQSAWGRYSAYSKNTRFPETVQEMNMHGSESLEDKSSPSKVEKAEILYYDFKNSSKYLHTLFRITPRLFATHGETLELLAKVTSEVNRRKRLVELALLRDRDEDQLKSKQFEQIVDHGFLGAVVESNNQDASKSLEIDDELEGKEEEEEDDDEEEDEQETDITADTSDAELHEPAVVKVKKTMTRLDENEDTAALHAVVAKFAELYGTMNHELDQDISARLERARNLRSLIRRTNQGKKGRSVSAQQLINELAPKTGYYAFVTFKEKKDADLAQSPAVEAFGVNICMPKNATTDIEPSALVELPEKNTKMDNYNVKIRPARERQGLFIEGFRAGITAGEVVFLLEELLRPTFPHITFDLNDRNCLVTNGGVFMRFNSHAESRAAYAALKDCIFEGHKLNVGWAERVKWNDEKKKSSHSRTKSKTSLFHSVLRNY